MTPFSHSLPLFSSGQLPLLTWCSQAILGSRFSGYYKQALCAQSLSHIGFLVIPWTVTRQAPSLSMEFSRQEYWSGLPFSPPRDLPNPGIEPMSPSLAVGYHWVTWTHFPGPLLIQLWILYVLDFDVNPDDFHENRIQLGYYLGSLLNCLPGVSVLPLLTLIPPRGPTK